MLKITITFTGKILNLPEAEIEQAKYSFGNFIAECAEAGSYPEKDREIEIDGYPVMTVLRIRAVKKGEEKKLVVLLAEFD